MGKATLLDRVRNHGVCHANLYVRAHTLMQAGMRALPALRCWDTQSEIVCLDATVVPKSS
ncbi:MAG: hypothetical protein QOC96_3610 [Acidobacteriota bacterium]|jgi:hypothetical protein|nr:hypothetical protein [Acidobacteriota bacterium]